MAEIAEVKIFNECDLPIDFQTLFFNTFTYQVGEDPQFNTEAVNPKFLQLKSQRWHGDGSKSTKLQYVIVPRIVRLIMLAFRHVVFLKILKFKKIGSCTEKSTCEGPVIEWKFNMGSFNPWKDADLAGKTDCMKLNFFLCLLIIAEKWASIKTAVDSLKSDGATIPVAMTKPKDGLMTWYLYIADNQWQIVTFPSNWESWGFDGVRFGPLFIFYSENTKGNSLGFGKVNSDESSIRGIYFRKAGDWCAPFILKRVSEIRLDMWPQGLKEDVHNVQGLSLPGIY